MGNPDLSIVILCYKSGESIKEFTKKTIALLENNNIFDFQLVLVGNYHEGTADSTPLIVKNLAKENNKITFVAKPKKGMMGWDMKCGLELARGRYIAVIDGDGQMPIEDLLKVYSEIKEKKLDLVKTYRLTRGDGIKRKILSTIYNIIFCLIFPGIKARDINSKPKIFSHEAYQRLHLTSDDWFIDAEIMIQSNRLNFKTGEIPTHFLGLKGSRKSFVGTSTIFEFIKNLIKYRIKEFKRQ